MKGNGTACARQFHEKIVCDPYVTPVFLSKNQSSYHFMHDYVLVFEKMPFFVV